MSVVKRFIGGQWVPVVIGAEGPQGIPGDKGDKGDKGDTGDVGPIAPLGDLTDVDTTGAADGDALVFDGTAGEWIAAPIPTVEVNDESLILATQVFG